MCTCPFQLVIGELLHMLTGAVHALMVPKCPCYTPVIFQLRDLFHTEGSLGGGLTSRAMRLTGARFCA